jgi:nicotinamidase-related amidase
MESIMPSLTLFPKSTALVLIDLQKGITSFPVEPHPTEVVLENASLLADQSTARSAYELGYQLLLVEDAMASFSKTQHDFATQNIFPRLGRVRTTVEIVRALRESD